MASWEENEEIKALREYLRIPSVHPDINYGPCVEFLNRQADEIGLEFRVVYPSSETKPLCVISYRGTDSALKSIMLSSHMDVVPVDRECWSHDPFAAEIDDDGKIFARGVQDTKAIGMQYLAALRHFARNGVKFRRTIHVTFTPEEEIGSIDGMREFVHTQEFRDLNVGFELDEGGPLPTEHFVIFYGERATWRVEFTITGEPGHGSIMIENTAAVKLQKLITMFTEHRHSEYGRLKGRLDLPMIGRITSSNVTMINGGLQSNVIPSEFKMMVDIRVSNDVDHEEFIKMFEGWCETAGGGITYRFELHEDKIPSTDISDNNEYWSNFKSTFDELGLKLIPIICPAATDARFVRKMGIPAIGFSPMNFTPLLAHAHDEFLHADTYLKGIDIYKKVIANLANLE